VPAAQLRQALAAPLAETRPAAHAEQLTAPSAGANIPAAHGAHESVAAPMALEYVPETQLTQLDWLGLI